MFKTRAAVQSRPAPPRGAHDKDGVQGKAEPRYDVRPKWGQNKSCSKSYAKGEQGVNPRL